MGKTQKIILKHSSIQGKTPKELEYGEPAVNYNAGNEFISIKNTNNEIVKFEAQPKVDLSQYAMKTELSNFLKADDLSQYAKIEDLSTFLKSVNLELYVKKEEIPINMLKSCLENQVSGIKSFAVGSNNKIFSQYSFASGNGNYSDKKNSYAFGERNMLKGDNTIALGISNTILNQNSAAIGSNNTVERNYSFAIGTNNNTKGPLSYAFGYGLSTSNTFEMALGRFNKSDGNTIFSIGNGNGKNDKKNVFSIAQDAKAYVVDIEDKSNKPQMICLQDKLPKYTVQLTFTLEDGTSQTLNVCTR